MTTSMSFRERLAWSSLGANIAVFGGYFMLLLKEGRSLADSSAAGYWILGGLAFLTLAFKVAQRVEAPPNEARADEREHLIDLKSARIAGMVTALGAGFCIVLMLSGETALFAANMLIGVLVLGQIAGAAARIYHFKAGS